MRCGIMQLFSEIFLPYFLFLLRGERIIPFENVRHTCKSPPLSSFIVDKSDMVFNESVYEQRLRAIRPFISYSSISQTGSYLTFKLYQDFKILKQLTKRNSLLLL